MPPQVLDSTPMAYQQAELAANTTRSLESQMSYQAGDVTAASSTFNFNDNQGPPTGAFTIGKDAAPDGTQFVAAAPQFVNPDQKVLPVDIAGTSISADTNQAAMELAQKSQIEGAYAANNLGQGTTAEVAYSSPVTTTSVDVVPPQVLDSTPMAYQTAEASAQQGSLETHLANQAGDLANSFNFNNTQGPPVGEFAKAASDGQQFVANATAVCI